MPTFPQSVQIYELFPKNNINHQFFFIFLLFIFIFLHFLFASTPKGIIQTHILTPAAIVGTTAHKDHFFDLPYSILTPDFIKNATEENTFGIIFASELSGIFKSIQ